MVINEDNHNKNNNNRPSNNDILIIIIFDIIIFLNGKLTFDFLVCKPFSGIQNKACAVFKKHRPKYLISLYIIN